jgi:hypothetical protein
LSLACACAGGGDNCTSDAKKNTIDATIESSEAVEPKNGRAIADFTLPVSVDNSLCNGLGCPGGQTATLVAFDAGAGGTFTVCTTHVAAGQPCSCDNAPTQGDLPRTITCEPTGVAVVFAGKKRDSCFALFPAFQ